MTLSPLAGLMWSKTGRNGVTVHPQVVVEASAEATNANGATAATRATRATLRGLGTGNFIMSPLVDEPQLRPTSQCDGGISVASQRDQRRSPGAGGHRPDFLAECR